MKYCFVQSRRMHNARVRLADPLYELYKCLDFYFGVSMLRGFNIINIMEDESLPDWSCKLG